MKHSYFKIMAIAVAAALGASSASAAVPGREHFDLTKFRYRIDSSSVFNNKKAQQQQAADRILNATTGMHKALEYQTPEPEFTLGPTSMISDLDGPNGERWFYTAKMDYREIPPHDDVWFTDRILTRYQFDIYNAQAQLVGSIKDDMDYAEDEERVVLCDLLPVVTANFFNTDDKMEFIVGLGVNSDTPGQNHYRTLVYQLNGKTEANGDDIPMMIMPDLVTDVIEGPAKDGKDQFYLTFNGDHQPGDDEMGDSFWEYVKKFGVSFAIYGPAENDTDGPVRIKGFNIPNLNLPGDQENIPAMMSLRRGDDIYFMVQYYQEPFYNPYNDPKNDDLTQREGNHLCVNIYKMENSELSLIQETKIPVIHNVVERESENGEVYNECIFTYYGIGYLRWRDDVAFTGYDTTDGQAALVVTSLNYLLSKDGTVASYYVYNPDGTPRFTIWKDAAATFSLSDLPGQAPAQLFMSTDAYGSQFNMVNLLTGKKDCTIDCNYYIDDDSDPEVMTANFDRVAVGDTYMYCDELRMPVVDEYENDVLRFMWLDKKGNFSHIDYVNMGTNVLYAQSYVTNDACQKGAYVKDAIAYMMLIKRGMPGELLNEDLLIAEPESEQNPEGKIALLTGPDEIGPLAGINPYFDEHQLHIYRSHGNGYYLEVYALPLGELEGIADATVEPGTVAIEGSLVKGDTITVYTTSGAVAATGNATLDLRSLSAGVYIIVADGKACKVAVK